MTNLNQLQLALFSFPPPSPMASLFTSNPISSQSSPLFPYNFFTIPTPQNSSFVYHSRWHLPQSRRRNSLALSSTYEVGGGFPLGEFGTKSSSSEQEKEKWDSSHYEAILKGGEQVVSVLEEMAKIVSCPFDFP